MEDIVNFHIRVRPSALVIRDDEILLVEYNSKKRGIHYYLPGGGADPGETIRQTVRREMIEETTADVTVGQIAFLYECQPQDRVDDYSPSYHTIFIIFDCKLIDGSTPRLPEQPDLNQTGVKWMPLDELKNIKLVPNIAESIIEYAKNKRTIELIEDHIVR